MVCDQCSKAQKIIFGIAGLLGAGGILLGIVGVVMADDGFDVDFAVEEKMEFTLTIDAERHCGYGLFVESSKDCQSTVDKTKITYDGQAQQIHASCGALAAFLGPEHDPHKWAKENDPPLTHMSDFHSSESGDYKVIAPNPLWAVDSCKEAGEAISGFVSMLGLFLVAIVIFIVSCILCCVACCCCQSQKPADQTVVVGTTVQGTTVGNAQG